MRTPPGVHIHCLVHLVGRKLAVDLLHSLARLLHGCQRLAVDVCRLDRVDLLFQRSYLRNRLLHRVFMGLLASQGRLGRCLPHVNPSVAPHLSPHAQLPTYRSCSC